MGKSKQTLETVDIKQVVNNFITFYYKSWMEDVVKLLSSPLWKEYTIFNFNDKKLSSEEIIKFHEELKGNQFELISCQFIPDGSRRIDILITGKIFNDKHSKVIVQTFALLEIKKDFYIKSSQVSLI